MIVTYVTRAIQKNHIVRSQLQAAGGSASSIGRTPQTQYFGRDAWLVDRFENYRNQAGFQLLDFRSMETCICLHDMTNVGAGALRGQIDVPSHA